MLMVFLILSIQDILMQLDKLKRKDEYIEKYQKKQKKEENYYLTQKEAMTEI